MCMYMSSRFVRIVKFRILLWVWRVHGMGDTSYTYRILVGKLLGKVSLEAKDCEFDTQLEHAFPLVCFILHTQFHVSCFNLEQCSSIFLVPRNPSPLELSGTADPLPKIISYFLNKKNIDELKYRYKV
jgi:hypothetical protein